MSTDEGRPGKDQDAPWTPSSTRPADPFEPDPSPADQHRPPKYDGPRGNADGPRHGGQTGKDELPWPTIYSEEDEAERERERMRQARAAELERQRWDAAYGHLTPAQRWLEGADQPGAPRPGKYAHVTWSRDVWPAIKNGARSVWSTMWGRR